MTVDNHSSDGQNYSSGKPDKRKRNPGKQPEQSANPSQPALQFNVMPLLAYAITINPNFHDEATAAEYEEETRQVSIIVGKKSRPLFKLPEHLECHWCESLDSVNCYFVGSKEIIARFVELDRANNVASANLYCFLCDGGIE